MNSIKLSVCQFVGSGDINKNKKKILSYMRIAAKQKSKLLLTHEACLSGYPGTEIASVENINLDLLSDAIEEISLEAKKLKIFVVLGTALYRKNKKTWTNSLFVINDKGKKVCTYDKWGLTRSDAKNFEAGVTTPTFKIGKVIFGLQICFDVRFPEMYRAYFKKGVHVVLHSYHQTGVESIALQRRDIITAFQRVRSSENGIYTATANAMDPSDKDLQWIPSMFINPRGDIIRALPSLQSGVLTCEIDADDILENGQHDIRKLSAQFCGTKKAASRKVSNNHIKGR